MLASLARSLSNLGVAILAVGSLFWADVAHAVYSCSVAIDTDTRRGEKYWIYVITEVDAAAATECTWTIPTVSTMVFFEADLVTAGTATTLDTELGVEAGWTDASLNQVVQNDVAAAYLHNATKVPIYAPTATLAMRTAADGTATAVTTRIVLREGVQ